MELLSEDLGKDLEFSSFGLHFKIRCLNESAYNISIFKMVYPTPPIAFPDIQFELHLLENQNRVYCTALSRLPEDDFDEVTIPNSGFFETEGDYAPKHLYEMMLALKTCPTSVQRLASLRVMQLLKFYETAGEENG